MSGLLLYLAALVNNSCNEAHSVGVITADWPGRAFRCPISDLNSQ